MHIHCKLTISSYACVDFVVFIRIESFKQKVKIQEEISLVLIRFFLWILQDIYL